MTDYTSHVFITGITGYIGGSVARKLQAQGYRVSGLVRRESDLQWLRSQGMDGLVGTIHQTGILEAAVSQASTIIHTADSADDPYAVDTFLRLLEGTGKTFLFTSGSAIFGGKENGEANSFVYTEDFPLEPRLEMASRVLINNTILRSAQRGVRSIVMVPTMVYGEGLGRKKDSIQLPALVTYSKEKGHGVYFGKGANIWSNLHIEDLADLYILAMQRARAGSIYYAENGWSTLKDLAENISDRLGLQPARSVSIQEAVERFGPAGGYFGFASNSFCSADKARRELAWAPQYSSIVPFIQR